MPNIYSFLQTAYHFVKSLVVSVTKKNNVPYSRSAVYGTDSCDGGIF